MPEDNNNPQLNLEEVVEVAPDDLSDEQKTFLADNVDDLTDEQAETFGLKKSPPPPVEPEVRSKPPEKKPEDDDTLPPLPDEIDPEDAKTIGAVVDRRLKPLQDEMQRQTATVKERADVTEVDNFIRENPQFDKYRGKMLTYMKHPAYSNIPAQNIARIVAGDDLVKMGAEKEREAAGKANESRGIGSSARQSKGGGKDWLKASKEEFDKQRAEVMGMDV